MKNKNELINKHRQ